MTEMMIILLAAAIGLGLARALKLPAVPLLVLAGIGLTVSGLLPDRALINDTLELGLAFLVFAAGTELNPGRIRGQGGAAVRVGVFQFVVLAALGFFVAYGLWLEVLPALYLALALSASSTLVVMQLLQQRQQFFEPFGRLVLGVLLLQDVAIIFLLAAISHIADGPAQIAWGVGGLAGMTVLAWVCLRWITPLLLLKMELDEETLLLAVLAILFFFLGLAYWLGVPVVAGAFLAGVSLAAFPVHGIVRGQLASLNEFFLALFFVALGAILTLPTLGQFTLAVGLALLVVVATPPLVYWIARRAGLSARASMEAGLLLAQTSEFSIVIALVGQQQRHFDEGTLVVIALVTVLTMIATPFLATDAMTWRLVRLIAARRRTEPTPALPERVRTGHILLVGCGEHGLRLLKWLISRGQDVVAIDEDPGVIQRVRALGAQGVRGDAADPGVLDEAGARSARLIISTVRRLHDHERLLELADGTPVLVRVFAPEEAERVRQLGGTPITQSQVAAAGFMSWFESRFGAA